MSLLFEPKNIGKMLVKNRFVRSPTGDKLATEDGKCTNKMVDFYRELADGGTGLIITGQAYIHKDGKGLPTGFGLHTDDVVDSYKKLTRKVHAHDAKIIAQIGHAGRTTFRPGINIPIAPSALRIEISDVTPREMTEKDMQELTNCYAQAARRAQEAGFDGIQIHACHGDLMHSFLSPYTNRRTDKWGGTFEKRMRFLKEAYEKCRELVDDYHISIKVNLMDYVNGGITFDIGKRIAEWINAKGFDAMEISAGTHTERHFDIMRGDIPASYIFIRLASEEHRPKVIKILNAMKDEVKFKEAYLRPFAKEIKPIIDIPLILPGGLRTVTVMEDVLKTGDADFIGLCRPLIRDPYFPNKVRDGLKKSDCLNCNNCIGGKLVFCYQKTSRPPHL